MESLLGLSPSSLLSIPKPCSSSPSKTPFLNPSIKTPPKKDHTRVQTTKSGSFLDLEPKSKPGPLNLDLPRFDPADRLQFDIVIIGAGPAGLRLAQQVSQRGIKVCCLDPSPLSIWPNNYGVWVDEFENLGFADCFDKTWPVCSVYIDDTTTKYLDRAYGRVNRKALKLKLLSECAENGVRFHKAKVWKVNHQEFESSVSCDDGTELKSNLVVDASGYSSSFVEYDKPRNLGYQICHGILAEVDSHPYDLNQMVLMNWSDSHLDNEPDLRASNSRYPTFQYAMPFDSNLIFLEEATLASRPKLKYTEVKKRMVARLQHLGIRVRSVIEDETAAIAMGGPLPKIPQRLMAMGASSGLVNPASTYSVAQGMALAPALAETIAECLGSAIRGRERDCRVWNALWPLERRCVRQYQNFGMETMLKLDLDGTRRFFKAFFELDPYYMHGFLSSTLSFREMFVMGLSLMGRASNPTRLEILKKCPVPLARMVQGLALELTI